MSAPPSHTLQRQWHMLQYLPRHPRKITVQDLVRKLQADGFAPQPRTVQRDLQALAQLFPLESDERSKPFGWCWRQGAPRRDLPGLTLSESLAWVLAEQHLQPLMPASVLENLQPQFLAAHACLAQDAAQRRSWVDKVRVVPPNQPLIPPRIDAQVQAVVSEALLQERQIDLRYRKRGDAGDKAWRVHPLALVQRGGVLYLYCRIGDHADARNLPLHRILHAQLRDEPARMPSPIDLDTQMRRGIWGFGTGAMVAVELCFVWAAGEHLMETPLSEDQQIDVVDGAIRVRATVADTPQLRWWLRAFGADVRVLAPESLRQEMAQEAACVAAVYAPPRRPETADPPV